MNQKEDKFIILYMTYFMSVEFVSHHNSEEEATTEAETISGMERFRDGHLFVTKFTGVSVLGN